MRTLVLTLLVIISAAASVAPAQTTAPATAATADAPAAQVQRPRTLYQKLMAGGWIVGVQLALSVVGLAFVIERLVSFRRGRVAPAGLYEQIDQLWRGGRLEEVDALCRRRPSTLSRMVLTLLAHRDGPAADASQLAADIGARELRLHLLRAYPIAVVATLEPLLGLFGTVWGMVLAFDRVAELGELGNAAALSNEISIALMTTAVGLAVAIPMLAMHHYFKSRASLFAIALETQAGELVARHLMDAKTPNAATRCAST